MPRNVLRQFTGGISNEIDPQNLREDQGEEALDINLKGFALEPGDGLEELTDAGHYHYRGEWIRDSEAVSFEESGIGVVKTYDNKRPQFEEIINDEENISRNLGPSLPPRSTISGSVVSEGSRGLRPAEGSHLLKLGSDKFGAVDTGTASNTPPYSDAPSLEEHRADTTTKEDNIYYYSGQPYWIDEVSSTNWKVTTREPDGSGGFTSNLVQSGNLTHHSNGVLFKEDYFICWDGQYIQTVQLSSSSMTINTFDTVDSTQNGDAGSPFNKTSGATGKSISSLDICNGVITFAQEIQTSNTTPAAYSDSANERWILPQTQDSILFLLRDNFNISGGESGGTYNAGTDDFEVYCKTGPNPPARIAGATAEWQTPRVTVKGGNISSYDKTIDAGIKWAAVIVKANEWAMVKHVGTNKPNIFLFTKTRVTPKQKDLANISISQSNNSTYTGSRTTGSATQRVGRSGSNRVDYFTVKPSITINIPVYNISRTYTNNSIPTGGFPYWTGDLYNRWQKTFDFSLLALRSSIPYNYSIYVGKKGIEARHWNWYPNTFPNQFTVSSSWTVTHGAPVANAPFSTSPFNFHIPSWYLANIIEGVKPTSFPGSIKTTANGGLKANNISGGYASYIQRLCSYVPDGSITLQTGFPKSKLWAQAVIDKGEKSIFIATTSVASLDKAFTVGDYIKVQANGTRTLSWNTATRKSAGKNILPSSKNMSLYKDTPQDFSKDYFIAKILSIDTSASKLFFERTDGKPIVNESCYPIINSIDPFAEETVDLYVHKDANTAGKLDGSRREVIQTDLFGHVLIGHQDAMQITKQTIEVRANSGVASTNTDYTHSIIWKDISTGEDYGGIKAVTTSTNAHPRILYKKHGKLYSQNGSDSDTAPSSRTVTDNVKYYLTGDYLTVTDSDNVTVYDPLYNVKYVKAKPEQSVGLGLTGKVEDALHIVYSSIVFVFVKIKANNEASAKWKLVRTGSSKSESSILTYDFNKPLHYDGLKAWGIYRGAPTEKFDIHTTVPFYESDLANSWVNHSSSSNNVSAWGQVLKTREAKADDDGVSRYLSVDWKFDSGVFNSTGDPTIGLNHETNKMLGDQNDFAWYPLDAPATLQSGGVGTQISDPKIVINFKSKVFRNVAFFKTTETVVPSTGQTGAQNRVSFTNYRDSGQNFYVINDKAIILKGGDDAEERGYMMGQADTTASAFDASKVGISAFLVGAPNMFNPFGPNIDFFYRASFIDKWGHESAPSNTSSEGIQPLDSADDCIQINFDDNFFHFDNSDIEKIRLYRYGGDSSEFMFLRDIEMPDLTGFPLSLTGISGSFLRKSTLSQFYQLKTNNDISKLSTFTNSNFDLVASPSDMDGSWNIIQLSENASPSPAYSSTISSAINESVTTIPVVSTTAGGTWPTSGVVKIAEEYVAYTGTTSTSITGCTRGYNDSTASAHNKVLDDSAFISVDVVEWILEMQHRNQDTTTLSVAIDTPITSSSTVFIEDAAIFQTSGKILIGNEILDYTGRDITTSPNKFTGVTNNSAGSLPTIHEAGVTVFSYEETFSNVSVTSMSIEINSFGYRDKARTPVTSLHYLQNDNYPPIGLEYNEEKKNFFETESADDYYRYITAVGSMYFGGLDANLKFSRFGTPEYWPLDAVVTLDSEIRAIMEHAGEGLVWTTNSLYRVRGTDPKAMIAFRVPDAHGIKAGDEHTVAEFGGGVLWLTANDGIAYYQGGRVQYLTRDKHIVTNLVKPHACVSDGVYWLFQKPGSGTGFRLEITGGDLRLCQTSIEAYYAHYSKAVGKGVVVTSDEELSPDTDETFNVSEIGGIKASNIIWKSKKIDAGEPALAKALGSLAIVYEVVESKSSDTLADGIRGQSLAASLLGMNPSDLDAGDLAQAGSDSEVDMYDVFINYTNAEQYFEIDISGENLSEEERKKVVMPLGFDTASIKAGDKIWNEMFADNTKVDATHTADLKAYIGSVEVNVTASDDSDDLLFTDTGHSLLDGDIVQFVTTNTLPTNITAGINYYVNDKATNTFKVETSVGGGNVEFDTSAGLGQLKYIKKTEHPAILLDKEPLRSGTGVIYWGNLPVVDVFINNETTPARSFTLPPTDTVEPLTADLYLEDLRRFRTLSVKIEGNVRVQTLSIRHYPLQQYQSQTLTHSADVFYKGDIDFRVMLDGELIYRKELTNPEGEFKEERIYLPASAFGQRIHYMNESKAGTIESVTFNGSMAA